MCNLRYIYSYLENNLFIISNYIYRIELDFMRHRLIIIALYLIFSTGAYAQNLLGWQLHDRYFSVFAGTGWTGYKGELTNNAPFSEGLSHFNVGVEARLYTRVGARIQLTRYTIDGSDDNAADSSANRQRNLSFISKNWEWQVQGVYYFFKYNRKYHSRRTYEPYVAAGFGKTYFNPQADFQGTRYELQPLGTENTFYSKSSWIIPVSLGVKAKLNEFFNLSLDLGYRFTFTGYLDDVSNIYGGPFPDGDIRQSLSNRKGEVGIINREAFESFIPGTKRGNGTNDGYFLINLNIELYLPRDLLRKKNGRDKKEKVIGKPSAYQ